MSNFPATSSTSPGDQRLRSHLHAGVPVEFDLLTVEAWQNSTKFTGDTFRRGKNTQIPTLREELFSPSGTSGSAFTDVRFEFVGVFHQPDVGRR